MSANDKKVRPANLTAAQTEFLVELALKYQAVIKNKKSDEVTAYVSCVQNSDNNELSLSVIVCKHVTMVTNHRYVTKTTSAYDNARNIV